MKKIKPIVENTIKEFCIDFVKNPYICYTEHGIHAYFFNLLFNNLPEESRYFEWDDKKICIVQKEYCMADACGKPRRQHWDISIIESPPLFNFKLKPMYDYFTLNSAIEFGLNEGKDHLEDDINRLCHPKSNVVNKYLVHLYRISDSRGKVSGRDISPKSSKILSEKDILSLCKNKDVDIYLGQYDNTKNHKIGVWNISNGKIKKILRYK